MIGTEPNKELWWGASQRSEKGSAEREEIRKRFVDIVETLLLEKTLTTLSHKHADNSFMEIAFDKTRLEDETRKADSEKIDDTDNFYWFETTESGTAEYNQMSKEKFQVK